MNDSIEYKVINDTQYVLLPEKILSRLEYILNSEAFKSYHLIRIIRNQLNNEDYKLKVHDYMSIISRVRVIAEVDERVGPILKSNNQSKEINDYINIANKAKEEYLSKKEDYKKKDSEMSFINAIYKICKTEADLFLYRDLLNAKIDITKDLEYFCNKEEIEYFKKDFDSAIKNHNTDNMKDILEKAQEKILDHYKDYITNIDNYNGSDDFKFICHSTISDTFSKEFNTKYVSASLISKDVLGTYHSGYGFILDPVNIVGASSRDMYILNNAEEDEDIITYSKIKKINAPERIIEECIKRQKESNHLEYNEIVLKGFNPVALFSLTDGSKELNYNYQSVKKLQNSFPNLKTIEIDITKYLDDNLLKDYKIQLIKNIKNSLLDKKSFKRINEKYIYLDVQEEELEKLEYFFTKFEELKKSKDYNKDDIIALYNKNIDLILKRDLTKEDLNNMTDEELKTLLLYNNNSNIYKILKGDYNYQDLYNLYYYLEKVKKDKRLDDIIPELTKFLDLFKNIPIQEEELELYLVNSKSIQELNTKLEKIMSITKKNKIRKIDQINLEIDLLNKEISDKENHINDINYYNQLELISLKYNLAITEKKSILEVKKNCLVSLKDIYNERISLTKEYNSYNKKRHLWTNKKKNNIKYNIYLNALNEEKERIIRKINKLDEEIVNINTRFKEETDISIFEYPILYENARDKKESKSIVLLEFEIELLKEKLNKKLEEKEKLQTSIDGIKTIDSREEKIKVIEDEEKGSKENISYRHML